MTEEQKSVTLLEAKIEDAREDLAKAQTKLDALLAQQANADKITALKVGDSVTFKYGRADKARDLTGTIVAVGTDEKTKATVLAIQTGEGVDIQTVKVLASAVKFEG